MIDPRHKFIPTTQSFYEYLGSYKGAFIEYNDHFDYYADWECIRNVDDSVIQTYCGSIENLRKEETIDVEILNLLRKFDPEIIQVYIFEL